MCFKQTKNRPNIYVNTSVLDKFKYCIGYAKEFQSMQTYENADYALAGGYNSPYYICGSFYRPGIIIILHSILIADSLL